MVLRILLWRIGGDWHNLRRIFFPGSETVSYFAFGANVSSSVLRQRRIFPFEERDYVLSDHRLRFTQPSPYAGVGFASADPAPGQMVYGKLYRILKADLRRLDFFEGVDYLARHRRVLWKGNEGEFYFYQATESVEGLAPTEQYKMHIIGGLADRPDVPESYLRWLTGLETREFEVLRPLPGACLLPPPWEHFAVIGSMIRAINRRTTAAVLFCLRYWHPFDRWIKPVAS